MSAGKTIIVPQGVINPNAMTVIEIPAESQHESVFVANVTHPQAQGMNCQYLFNQSNVEPPREFRPRFESSPLENRPVRDPTPVTMDSSIYRNQMQTQSGSPGTPMDYSNIWKPDYGSPSVDFTNSNMSENMSLKLTSKTSIKNSGSNAELGAPPTRTMVTTTKLINLSSADRPWDYYQPKESPGWLPRYEGGVHSPENINDMRYCNAQSSRMDGSRDNFYSDIEDSENTGSSGALQTSMFKKLIGVEMPRQMVMPMMSPIERQGYPYDEYGMPIGPSPPKSYYKKAHHGKHDQKIVSTVTMDERSGMATSNVTRSSGSPHKTKGQQNITRNVTPNTQSGGRFIGSLGQQQNFTRNISSNGSPGTPYNSGQICAGSVCAGGTNCKSAAIMALTSPNKHRYNETYARPKSPLNTTRPRDSTPQSYSKRAQAGHVSYMQAIPPAAAGATGGVANATFCRPGPALNKSTGVPTTTFNTTFTDPGQLNQAFVQPSVALNATYLQPKLNNTCIMHCSGKSPAHTGIRPRSRSPPLQGTVMLDRKAIDTVPNALLSAEREERRMIDEDLTRLQMERRKLFANANLDDRARLRKNLFGPDYKEDKEYKVGSRKQLKPFPERPRSKMPRRF